MLLTSLSLPPTIDTSSADLVADFFVPALACSVHYDRGVGFFSSAWVRVVAAGMAAFAANGGRARWVTSPILSEADWKAIETGDAARVDPVLRAALERNVADLAKTLAQDTLSALAWMVADEIITFRLALPRNKLERGDFHDKFGVFTDAEGNRVSFNGSYNDSIQGLRNYESVKIFCSWQPAFAPLVRADAERFERLWNNFDPNVRIFELPEAARAQILQLRTDGRPYPEPEWVRLRRMPERRFAYRPARPALPGHIVVRDYQLEAINAWFAHDCRGLLEMATGTGKTITALAASARLYEREGRLAVVIAAPYQHLVDQWHEEAQAFGYQPILAYQSKARWLDELNHQIMEYTAGYRRFISVITTHTTFISSEFQDSLARLSGPSLLIADEAHHLGAERSRQNYPQHIPFRLALSATPDRWFDDVGTAALRAYFGETVFSFPLEKAIGVSLTPYYYYPHLVPLTDEELERYQELSAKIARVMGREDDEGQQILKMLLIRRAELLNKAENKLEVLSELVDAEQNISHALFYCAPGQIDEVLRLLGWEKGLLVHRFTAEEDAKERQRLLTDFARGDLQGLVAMKCLDEGVDVPDTRTAFFLASSSNPREFIQRRGRILRKASGKEFSVIHDLLAVPPTVRSVSPDSPTFEAERSIIRRELQRFKEFANPALNKHQALDVIWDIAKRYSLMDF
ncbi:MAG: DEAD/DEAH box helicase family protein [Ardenticatenaceae bacterium]|nr:DEAD/DEAH box helicase family protein [Ardenticatenaceae bacterium]